ncbi:hypothetical protein H3H36_20345 [Duganella sp. FT3S]|uniref:Tetratricopeptide repeat protein n=1 Tax=Rugamonas fusca TaxID=2758568 RepID=A0A7W2I8K7_9BURK|nr:hypothetical protein [Rugamonas fusca]MBA5607712.1 hypothetical protein [Rugamonas fusca]
MVKQTGSISGVRELAREPVPMRQAGTVRPMAAAAVAVLVLVAGAGLYYAKFRPAAQETADDAASHPAPPPEAGPVLTGSKTVNELMNLAIGHIEQGNLDEAEKDLQAARAHAPQQPLVAYNTAILRVKQHRKDDALRELEASFAAGFSYFDQLDMDNDLDPLRDDPRFVALVAKYRKAPAK